MKILFFPHYFYLNLPTFELIIRELNENIDAYIIRGSKTRVMQDEKYNEIYFNEQNIKFKKIDFVYRELKGNDYSIPNLIKRFYIAIKNFKIIEEFIIKEMPDYVIVGSDLGDLTIRFLLEICMIKNIPIIIVYSCDVPPIINSRLDLLTSLLYKSKNRTLRFLRAIIFRNNIVGTFAQESTICLTSSIIKNKLLGIVKIDKNRINIFNYPIIKKSNLQLYSKMGLTNSYKIITIFTECIDSLYGLEYIKQIYSSLANILINLDFIDLYFIIKLHPLETKAAKEIIYSCFNNYKFKILEEISAEELILASYLNIAHYSKVLLTSSLLNKYFLSINILNDRMRTFIPETEGIIEAKSINEVEEKIKLYINNSEFQIKALESIRRINKNYSEQTNFNFNKLLRSIHSNNCR
ncbi:MAG: hypothetical protein ACYC2T_06315 [Bacillota bacterium]